MAVSCEKSTMTVPPSAYSPPPFEPDRLSRIRLLRTVTLPVVAPTKATPPPMPNATFLASVQPVTVTVAAVVSYRPPPSTKAELLTTSESVNSIDPVNPTCVPPPFCWAELPLIVVSMIMASPMFSFTPPPESPAPLSRTKQWESDRPPASIDDTPPPLPAAKFCSMMSPFSVRFPGPAVSIPPPDPEPARLFRIVVASTLRVTRGR